MKKSINIFYPPDDPNTGGWLVESKLFDVMRDDGRISMHYVRKSNFFAPRYRFWNIFAIVQMHKLIRYDILFINSDLLCNYMRWFVRVLKFFYPKKTLVTSHHHFEYHLEPSFEKVEKSMLRHCDYIISYSRYVHEELLSLFPEEKLLFAPIPFDLSGVHKSSHEKGRLLFVGTVEPRKGLEYLIDALALLDREGLDFSLDIVGNDVAYPEYTRSLLDKIGMYSLDRTVKMHGRLSPASLESFYRNAYCFVFPSLLEGFGMVIIEAMSHGIPVIAFDNSAMPYTVIDGKNGLLARDRDAGGLADCIRSVLDDEGLHSRLSAGSLETASRASSGEDFAMGVRSIVDTLSK